jgi:prepilin-type N-terminal cleavage/methylation domain-containing protein
MSSVDYSNWRKVASKAGFTLVELLVVVAIIGMLVSISVKYMNDARNRAKETQTAANLSQIHGALEAFATDNNGFYPFRVRWFNPATVADPNFDQYSATDTGGGKTSNAQGWSSMGLFGGVRTAAEVGEGSAWELVDNTWYNPAQINFYGANGPHGLSESGNLVQPHYGNFTPSSSPSSVSAAYTAFYEQFNEYSDPLVAMGYLDAYPVNPFLKRPMGNIMWTYGIAGSRLDKTIPGPDVVPSPGDFCYTFFYGTNGANLVDPPGVVEAKKSYIAKAPHLQLPGVYYLDLVDSYQLWAYGKLSFNGGTYVAYPNNAAGLATRGSREAKRDWDNSGTKDMFEIGMISYYKQTGAGASQASDAHGNKVEF